MKIGLSSWIIADGNYGHFKCGDRASFAVAFYPANSPFEIPKDWLVISQSSVDELSMHHVEGSDYTINGKVTHVFGDDEAWWVIDAGILMYGRGKPPEGVKPGCWVSGKVYLGIDAFDYFERHSRYYAAPGLIYDWDITNIQLETTPVLQEGRLKWRDQSARAWRDVEDTRAHCEGALVDEYVLHCTKTEAIPRR